MQAACAATLARLADPQTEGTDGELGGLTLRSGAPEAPSHCGEDDK